VDAGAAFLVGPDNGLLMPAVDRLGEIHGTAARLYAVDRPDLYLDHRHDGHTFHGRDRFAPVTAALLRGEGPGSLGIEIDDPIRLDLPEPRREDGCLLGTVVHIDRYGNLVTDVPSRWLERPLKRAEVETATGPREVPRRIRHYAELAPGEAGMLPGSLGTEEFSLPGESLATRWRVTIGAPVRIYLR
jgi:S-adenosylmethionine hydrolase